MMCVDYEYYELYTVLTRIGSVVFNRQSKRTEITTYIDISVDRKGMSKICFRHLIRKENNYCEFPSIAAPMIGKDKTGSVFLLK